MNLRQILSTKDRRFIFFGGVLVFLLIVASAILQDPKDTGSIPSSYSAQSNGAKAGYMLLEKMGYNIERWTKSPQDLPEPGEGYVLILADPLWNDEVVQDKMEIERFLQTGGHILATGYMVGPLLPQADISPEPLPSLSWSTCKPADVSPLTRGGPIAMIPAAHWSLSDATQVPQYYCDDEPVVVKYPVGRGEVIWWAAATPLTNAALQEQGNLQLFLGSVGEPANLHVLWDEYFHGDRPDLVSYTYGTPLWWIFLQLGLLGLAVLLTYSRRSDPIRSHDEPSRLSPMEFVETLGGVYDRAVAANVAVQIAFDRFRTLLCHRLGLSVDTAVDELASATRARMGYKNDALEADLEEARHSAYDYELAPGKALQLTQRLHDHLRALKLIAGEPGKEHSSGD